MPWARCKKVCCEIVLAAPESTPETQRGLDHFVLAVRDLAAAEARFQALGFTTTPRARHPWGTENVLVQMQGCFIELLGIAPGVDIAAPGAGEFSFGHFNQDYLREQQGLSMLVFSSEDASADRRHWLAQGLSTYAPFDFSRTATLADGQQVPVAFSLAFVSHNEMPRAAWFVCQQHYPENFWKPDFQRHANGAHCVDAVTLAATDPGRYGKFLAALFPEGQLHTYAGGLELILPRGRVRVAPPSALVSVSADIENRVQRHGPVFANLEIKVQCLGSIVEHLQCTRIPHRELNGAILVPPAEVFGLALKFSTRNNPRM